MQPKLRRKIHLPDRSRNDSSDRISNQNIKAHIKTIFQHHGNESISRNQKLGERCTSVLGLHVMACGILVP